MSVLPLKIGIKFHFCVKQQSKLWFGKVTFLHSLIINRKIQYSIKIGSKQSLHYVNNFFIHTQLNMAVSFRNIGI